MICFFRLRIKTAGRKAANDPLLAKMQKADPNAFDNGKL